MAVVDAFLAAKVGAANAPLVYITMLCHHPGYRRLPTERHNRKHTLFDGVEA